MNCQKRKFRDYRIRLLYELQKYPNSIFITLTFDNPSLSEFQDNPNRSIRLFLDRVRKKYGKQVRHWIVAEYGSKHGRLHYHGILFDIDIGNDELFSLWKYGNTFVGYANEATAKYIVKYLTKQDTKGICPPRIITSKGIGESWLNTPECKLAQKSLDMILWIDGKPSPIPRYYVQHMYTSEELEQISYYYYMETPPPQEWFLLGRKYTSEERYLHERKNILREYKQQGFLFDDYIKREQGLSADTRYRVLLDVISKHTNFNYF